VVLSFNVPSLAVVLDIVDNDFYKLATKNGVINRLYTRNQFSVCKENLISITDVQRDVQISLREASTSNWWARIYKM